MEEVPKAPVRVRESPAPSILRLSLIVYAAVILITALAVWAWERMGKGADTPIEPSPRAANGAVLSRMIPIPGNKPFLIEAVPVTTAEFCAIIHCEDTSRPPNFPAVNMTIAQARQYARYKGKRLPTAPEWEQAVHSAASGFETRANLSELVEGPDGPRAEAAGGSRPIAANDSAPNLGFRCAKDP